MPIRLALLAIVALLASACSLPVGPQPDPTPTLAPGAEELIAAATVAPSAAPRVTPTTAASATALPEPTPGPSRYVVADCEFTPPAGVEVECGWLTTPEDRARPEGAQVRLHVAVFRSTNANPPSDPIVYLEGGPGVDALERLPLVFDVWFRPFVNNRDFILFDQRGTGYSKPSLACPEVTKLSFDLLPQDLRSAESAALWTKTILECRDRLAAEGIDLGMYNSLANAADLEDLRIALGYEQWNLVGSSYGTRLALTALREYPQGIRSVVLDSTRPLQINESQTPADAERAFQQLFTGCAADETCNTAYPDLEQVFYDLVAKLNAEPVTVPGIDPFTGQGYEVLINGDSMISTLFQALYSTDIIPALPRMIYDAAQKGEFSPWVRLIMNNVSQSDFFSYGVMYSVRCFDEISFETREQLVQADQAFPQQQDVFDMASFWDICAGWGAGAAPAIENEPVTSDTPALILAGRYDPATPPDDGRDAAKTLTNGYFYEFPGAGHGVSLDGGCALGMTLAFLDDPSREPNAACMAQMGGPPFEAAGAPVRMIAYRDSEMGISGVVPQGWTNAGQGVYARSAGDAALVQWSLPIPLAQVLNGLERQFNLDTPLEAAGEYQSAEYPWQLYTATIRGQPADIALSEFGDGTLLVMLISEPAIRDDFYAQVFLPALDALRVD